MNALPSVGDRQCPRPSDPSLNQRPLSGFRVHWGYDLEGRKTDMSLMSAMGGKRTLAILLFQWCQFRILNEALILNALDQVVGTRNKVSDNR
jgi:hypothetical protein